LKEIDLQNRKNQIKFMLNDINKLDISQDEIALKDIDTLSEIDASNALHKKPLVPPLDFSRLKSSSS
jgi:hypothetical protein